MSSPAVPPERSSPDPAMPGQSAADTGMRPRGKKRSLGFDQIRLTSHGLDREELQHQAELFYLHKQIQAQTPMVVVIERGEQIRGKIEWYDRHCIKVRGREKILIYKSTIKYMYKEGENGE